MGPAARNTVTVDDNGCVVIEHWSAPSGSEGQSFNIFDRSIGTWRQTWVGNIGGQHDYRGGLKDGNMVYVGNTPPPSLRGNGRRWRGRERAGPSPGHSESLALSALTLYHEWCGRSAAQLHMQA